MYTLSGFDHLPDSADTWIYVAERKLSDEQCSALRASLGAFSKGWSSHGRIVHAGFAIHDSQILVLSAFVDGGDISGCGIDKSLHLIDAFAADNEFAWASALSVVYRDGSGDLRVVSRPEFRSAVTEGIVDTDTVVVDTSIRILSAIREGGLEVKAGTTWHSRVFRIPSTATV